MKCGSYASRTREQFIGQINVVIKFGITIIRPIYWLLFSIYKKIIFKDINFYKNLYKYLIQFNLFWYNRIPLNLSS